ncbi:hypothetical protein RDWZM_002512 [Blomia tropicalis]|uniref:SGNH hydrolase-type esterase domain-containing protein n=1 Tax=Blomia tropicalis TaxID=40697 RepID=A0A9Q0MGH2_BLOTA|nr:hypothetical protein RDWZM_002512 [Blomia tropicalis]
MSLPKIVLFGDSHSQRSFDPKSGCWGALLADKFQRIADVISRGFSGYTTRFCKQLMRDVFQAIPSNEIACVTILLGSNDATDPSSPSGLYVPIGEYATNLEDIVNHLESVGIPKNRVIMMSPPNYFHETFHQYLVENNQTLHVKSDKQVKEYAQACKNVAAKLGVTFLDLNDIFSSHPESPTLFADGLHFSTKGAELLDQYLYPLMLDKVERFVGTKPLNVKFPLWNEIDRADPSKSFQ